MTRTREEIEAILFPDESYPVAKRVAAMDDIPYTPTVNAPEGSIIVMAGRVLVANGPLLVGYRGSLTAVGVFAFPKATGAGTAFPKDTLLYWDTATGVVTPDSAGDTRPKVGTAPKAASDADDTVRLILGG